MASKIFDFPNQERINLIIITAAIRANNRGKVEEGANHMGTFERFEVQKVYRD